MVFTISKAQLEDGLQQKNDLATNERQIAVDGLIQRGVWELIDKVDIEYFYEHAADMCTIRRL